MELTEFIKLLENYNDRMSYDERVDEESFNIIVKCNDRIVIEHTVIKCKCESADEIRQYVYERVLYALYEKGIAYIQDICGNSE